MVVVSATLPAVTAPLASTVAILELFDMNIKFFHASSGLTVTSIGADVSPDPRVMVAGVAVMLVGYGWNLA